MLSIDGLNTHYGASHILQGVDLVVPQGRICSILGRNGVGKTTTVRTVMGLVPPSGGRVILDGADITGFHFRHVGLRLPLQQHEVAETFGRVARDVVQRRIRLHGAG